MHFNTAFDLKTSQIENNNLWDLISGWKAGILQYPWDFAVSSSQTVADEIKEGSA